jgi:hypothetical protein
MVVSPYSEFDFFPAVGGVYCDSGMVKLLFLRSISDDGGFSGWSVVPARGDLFLGWFFIGVQVSLSCMWRALLFLVVGRCADDGGSCSCRIRRGRC